MAKHDATIAWSNDDPEGFAAVEGADVTPLPLARPSHEPSLLSDDPAGSRLATGTG